jgi:hypothetical protein
VRSWIFKRFFIFLLSLSFLSDLSFFGGLEGFLEAKIMM